MNKKIYLIGPAVHRTGCVDNPTFEKFKGDLKKEGISRVDVFGYAIFMLAIKLIHVSEKFKIQY